MTAFNLTSPFAAAVPVAAPGVSADAFKDALARLAGGLAIVSCWKDGQAEGLLVSSITGLSVEPPRFLFCVRKEASAHDALVSAPLCGVSILSSEDEAEALTFIEHERRVHRFAGPNWRVAEPHPPLLASGLSATVCLIEQVVDADSHSILIAAAQSLTLRPGDPLLSYDRGLHRLGRA